MSTNKPASITLTSPIDFDTGVPGDRITSDNTQHLQGTYTGTGASNSSYPTLYVYLTQWDPSDPGHLGDPLSCIQICSFTPVFGGGTWDAGVVTIPDGTYEITLSDFNTPNNPIALSAGSAVAVTTSSPFTIDTEAAAPGAPDLTAASDSGASNTDNITDITTPTFTGSGAEAGATVKLFDGASEVGSTTADGSGDWSITSSSLSVGSHTLTATQTDAAGNTSAASSGLTVTIETPPLVLGTPDLIAASDSGASDTDNITGTATPTFTGSGAEAGAAVQLYDGASQVGSTTADGSGNWSITSSVLVDGSHSLTAQTVLAGNTVASSALNVIVDTAALAPSAPDLAAATDSGTSDTDNITNFTTPTFTGSAEAGATVHLYDGASEVGSATANGSGIWSIDSSPLIEGAHTLTVTQTDVAGNVSVESAGLTITVDTAPPGHPTIDSVVDNLGVPIADGANTGGLTPTLSGTAEPDSIITIFNAVDSSLLGTAATDVDGNWTFTPAALPIGEYDIITFASDAAGNASDPSALYTFFVVADTEPPGSPTIDLIVNDFAAPVANGTSTNDQTPTLSGTAEPGTLITIYNQVDMSPLGTTLTDVDGNWTFTPASDLSFTPGGDVNGEYDFVATATDAAGNIGDLTSIPYTIFIQDNPVCFLAGTLIATAAGERPIESLAIGEMVTLADGTQKPIKWLGRMTVNLNRFNRHCASPILIRAGALGGGLPKRDLYTSYRHGFAVNGVLVIAGLLVNGTSIVQCSDWKESSVTFYQVEVEGHELMLAEGAAAETFGEDGDNRELFDNAAEFHAMYPDAVAAEPMPMGRAIVSRQIPRAVKATIESAAVEMGYVTWLAAA